MEKKTTLFWLSVLVSLWVWLNPSITRPAEGQATIRGIVYISPSGKLEGDLVMRAAEVEVLLLRDREKFEAEFASIRKSREPTIAAQFKAVTRAQRELRRSNREEREKKSALLRQERIKLAELRDVYKKQVEELIAEYSVAKTETDSQGNFTFTAIASGKYLIYAHFEIAGMEIHYYWLLPVELQGDQEIEVSLNKLNALALY
ncbi:MAG: hypothetical protein ACE5JU_15705 [Candidatus Binatia bacterium]